MFLDNLNFYRVGRSLIKPHWLVTLLMIFGFQLIFAQTSLDTTELNNSKFKLKNNIVPLTLLVSGALIHDSTFEQDLQVDIRNKVGNDYNFAIDDYIQYAPIAQMYIADIVGIQSKNHWFHQTKYLFISNLITGIITHSGKRIMQKTRPNGSPYAMPSGHTSFSFTNASVLFQEFKDSNPLLAYSGYAMSSTTGIFRILNNRHWVSDVLVGAAIGILVTELVYKLQPFKNFNPFKDKNHISISTEFTPGQYGFGFYQKF